MKILRLLSVLSVSLAVAHAASAQSSVDKGDADRLIAIAQANMAEVAAGKLALDKASNAEVKSFAQMMIDDHSKGLDETKKVAAAKKITLPSEPDPAHKKMASDLEKLSGPAFDKEYAKKAGVLDHTKVHAALKNDIANAKDPDIKALATKLEPTVAHHLAMAKKLDASIK